MRHRADFYYNHGIRGWNPPCRLVRDERTWTSGVPSYGLSTGIFRKLAFLQLMSHLEEDSYAFFIMSGLSVAFAGIFSMYAIRRSGLHVFSPHSQLLTDLVVISRLHQIRKVGLLSDSKQTPPRRPWIPLPLRRRTQNDWL